MIHGLVVESRTNSLSGTRGRSRGGFRAQSLVSIFRSRSGVSNNKLYAYSYAYTHRGLVFRSNHLNRLLKGT